MRPNHPDYLQMKWPCQKLVANCSGKGTASWGMGAAKEVRDCEAAEKLGRGRTVAEESGATATERTGHTTESWFSGIQARELSGCDCAARARCKRKAGFRPGALFAWVELFLCGTARGCGESAGAAVAADVRSIRVFVCAGDFRVLFEE